MEEEEEVEEEEEEVEEEEVEEEGEAITVMLGHFHYAHVKNSKLKKLNRYSLESKSLDDGVNLILETVEVSLIGLLSLQVLLFGHSTHDQVLC